MLGAVWVEGPGVALFWPATTAHLPLFEVFLLSVARVPWERPPGFVTPGRRPAGPYSGSPIDLRPIVTPAPYLLSSPRVLRTVGKGRVQFALF